jgi:hypothetical protein
MATPLPPIVHGPITPITPRVRVSGVLQEAIVTLRVGASDVGQDKAQVPGDLWVTIASSLTVGQLVFAVQSLDGKSSAVSNRPVDVVNPPDPLPSPVFGSALSQCMAWLMLDNLVPGATVIVRQGNVTVAKTKADAINNQWISVDPSAPLSAGQPLVAMQEANFAGTTIKSPE